MDGHSHHGEAADGRRVAVALAAVVVLGAVELVVGVLSHSLALSSDAGHLATDAVTMSLVWYGLAVARRPASARHTFGHHRRGILIAAINGVILLGVGCVIAAEAIHRLLHPGAAEQPLPVIAVAAISLVVNGLIARSLHLASDNLSMRAALLHVLADALAAVSVLVAAVVVLTTGWQAADPVASLLIAVLIALGALRLLREAGEILVEGTPRDLDLEVVRSTMRTIPGIDDVHDLHVWSLDHSHRALSAHVSVGERPLAEVSGLLLAVERRLCADFGIEHVTLQPECATCATDATPFCAGDERHAVAHSAH